MLIILLELGSLEFVHVFNFLRTRFELKFLLKFKFFYFKLIFLVFLNYFDVLMLKSNLKK